MMRAEIGCHATFQAEHTAPGKDLHRDTFKVRVTVAGPIINGIVMPFEDLRAAVGAVVRMAESELPAALPDGSSVEQIARWLWVQLKPTLPLLYEVHLTDGDCFAAYWGGE